ncbi:lipopolysaccharide biosynthesis protein [Bradyrhizobium sp. WSM 1704]|uniref:lipopolysaccharide biosynthesis protein n=1 Tax=Bradyrhizobium semiaridum TaxID=2821404 RepID=UPI001CE3829B|nr:lipopolysaccharide biosynthesis protein [Bradyrhizobium semiaridum]MCA6125693.1 lipopolysaccharide biosynthesis protein [Bradyrhizobium semiaridum]
MLYVQAVSRTISTATPMVVSYLLSSGSLAAASIAQLVTFAILARALGPAEFGLFVQISAATAIAAQICGLGGSDCLLRGVARDRARYAPLLGHNLLLIGLSGIVLVLGGVAAMEFWTRTASDPAIAVSTVALLLFSNIVLIRLILLVETVFLGLGEVRAASRSVIGFALARTATAALACFAFKASSLAEWAVWQFCGHLLYALVALAWLRPLGRPQLAILRAELRPGILFSSQFVVRALRSNVDLFVIGLFTPIETVGSYGVARRIMDSSYLSIDAFNRLIYPRFARASHDGLHLALPAAKRALVAALGLGVATFLAVFALAPELPLLFGREYHDLPFFVRCLSGTVILIGAWGVAIDLLGASGRQGARALILNSINLVGSGLIAAATWLAAPIGTFVALYAIEVLLVISTWLVLLRLSRRSRRDAAQFATATAAPSGNVLDDAAVDPGRRSLAALEEAER